MNLKEKVQQLASDYHQEIVDIRRHLHQHPELSFQEVETGKFIAQKLKEYGINTPLTIQNHCCLDEANRTEL